jgi:hypothetical protein
VHTHKQSFLAASSPEELLNRFRCLSSEKGWTVMSADPRSAHAQSGLSWRSAGEDITVSVDPEAEGTRVEMAVTPRLGKLQVIDWAEGSAFAREIAGRMTSA